VPWAFAVITLNERRENDLRAQQAAGLARSPTVRPNLGAVWQPRIADNG
jgi:hypothetical protein